MAYTINWKHNVTDHAEPYWRSGTLGHQNHKPIRLAIYPSLDDTGWLVGRSGSDYFSPLEGGPRSLEEAFSLAFQWYQNFKQDTPLKG